MPMIPNITRMTEITVDKTGLSMNVLNIVQINKIDYFRLPYTLFSGCISGLIAVLSCNAEVLS